ncbi:uncharacterized protein LOC113352102 [Papaver somniferum]|uniref:uncharacterized protein LOC113352102 n=1 Tax=Papaver somniferum TaxID=3469 RepID=UPI000E7043EB|nr:uncharacterized protein LOC113352102 [Papaver somniferum]
MEIHIPSASESNTGDKLLWTYIQLVKGLAPKIQIFVWRILKNGLAVAGNISKHINDVNADFVMDTQAALFASPLNFRIHPESNGTIQDYIVRWINEGGDYSRLKMGACMLWAIWKTRNRVIFEKAEFNITAIIKEALVWSKESWEPPPRNKIKVNFDGAAGDRGYACSAIARNWEAEFKGCQNKELTYMSAMEAEANGALLAVELAASRGYKEVITEGDSLIVINSLKYKNYQHSWRIQNIISKIQDLSRSFNSVTFLNVRKVANSVAHNLASHAVTNHSSGTWLDLPPSCIADFIKSEATFSS